MSTQIYDNDKGTSVTRFWGGQDTGVCYQVTSRSNAVQLTRVEAKAIAEAILENIRAETGG